MLKHFSLLNCMALVLGLVSLLIPSTAWANPTSLSFDTYQQQNPRLNYDDTVEGRIDNTTPEQRYQFTGNADDVIAIHAIAADNASLDTTLTLLDPAGDVLATNDDANFSTTNSALVAIALPNDGDYTIVVSRFNGSDGTTQGDYTLMLLLLNDDEATATEENPAAAAENHLRYGDSITDTINDTVFEQNYTFDGRRGDVITIEMNRTANSSLDPMVFLVDPNSTIIARNDDRDFSSVDAAIADFTLPMDGIYTIVATRFGTANGSTSGNFELTLTSVESATPPSSNTDNPTTALSDSIPLIAFNVRVSGMISDDILEYRYQFEGQQGDIITISMETTNGNLDSYLSLLDAEGNELIFNDDNLQQLGHDAMIQSFRLPADGTYIIVATRYGVFYGTTNGSFRLRLTRE